MPRGVAIPPGAPLLYAVTMFKYSAIAAGLGLVSLVGMACALYIAVADHNAQYIMQLVQAVMPFWLGAELTHKSHTAAVARRRRRRTITTK